VVRSASYLSYCCGVEFVVNQVTIEIDVGSTLVRALKERFLDKISDLRFYVFPSKISMSISILDATEQLLCFTL
jgi:hypothetical protein